MVGMLLMVFLILLMFGRLNCDMVLFVFGNIWCEWLISIVLMLDIFDSY